MINPVVIAYTQNAYLYDFPDDWASSALHFMHEQLKQASKTRDPEILLLDKTVRSLLMTPVYDESFDLAAESLLDRYNQLAITEPSFGLAKIIVSEMDVEPLHPKEIEEAILTLIQFDGDE